MILARNGKKTGAQKWRNGKGKNAFLSRSFPVPVFSRSLPGTSLVTLCRPLLSSAASPSLQCFTAVAPRSTLHYCNYLPHSYIQHKKRGCIEVGVHLNALQRRPWLTKGATLSPSTPLYSSVALPSLHISLLHCCCSTASLPPLHAPLLHCCQCLPHSYVQHKKDGELTAPKRTMHRSAT